jgi:DNA-directed DNA polymerase|uniref:DNA polymerase I n=1 Tax=Siphoviridae sp. ctFiA6 TaxID=2823573 RepID=A0A8S5LGL2_9CAUD|nr:MAG TPA: DNA polymerase I [Siphoviridae sp. ctFiA6]
MIRVSIDLETFSSVDIKKAGAYAYVRSPDFEIMLAAYSINGGPVQILDFTEDDFKTGMDLLYSLIVSPEVEKCAYNATFEWLCLSKYFGHDLPLEGWACTMHHGLYLGYPGGLAAIGEAIGLPQDKRKMGVGLSLIRKFCVPRKPTKTDPRIRILPQHEPEKWQLFREYCKQDVVTEMTIKNILDAYPVPDDEMELWRLDLMINNTGVAVDEKLIEGALYCSQAVTESLMEEAKEITGLNNPKSVQQLTKWLEEETGEEVDNLRKDTVSDMIKDLDSERAVRMLEIRQELSKTSVKKYDAMKNALCDDGRIRGLLQFYGGNRTGRWAGRLVQVQNLPRNHMDMIELARDLVKAKDLDSLKMVFGNVPDTLSQLIRTAFIPAQGNKFIVADFSAIEARVIAWLSGEGWRQEVFATHGKIYEASASAMFGVPIERIKKGNPEYALRQKGKIAELALGYQGHIGALKAMGADKMGLDDNELLDIVARWRGSNKKITELWYRCENAVVSAMQTGTAQNVNGCTFRKENNFMVITLPSGRELFYVDPTLRLNEKGKWQMYYKGVDQNTKKWTDIGTYGGKIVENIVQAIARDCLANSMIKTAKKGFKIVMHIHDEMVVDSPQGGELKELTDIMAEPVPWANGLILRGDGFESLFYKKD